MDKLGYARGLVKYSTQNAVAQHWSRGQVLRHVLRPRVLVYTGILAIVIAAMAVSIAVRDPFKVDVVRDRGSLARLADGGKLENVFRLQIMNVTEATQTFRVVAQDMPGLEVVGLGDLPVASTEARWVAVRVQLPYEGAQPGSHNFHFQITALESGAQVREKSVFIVPR
jgi:polyferredoxin